MAETFQKYTTFHFQGFSMFPLFRPGDRFIVRRGSPAHVKVGDIILFAHHQTFTVNGVIAHRVIRMTAKGACITKGDNLPFPDPGFRNIHDILGKAIMRLRKNRITPLNRGLHRWTGRWMALCSRKNITPGIIISNVKKWLGQRLS